MTFLASLMCAFIPRIMRPIFALAVSLFALMASYHLFALLHSQHLGGGVTGKTAAWDLFGLTKALKIDNLSAFVLLFVPFFGSLIILYSAGFLKNKNNTDSYDMYYPYILATIAASVGTVLSNNLLVFVGFWGFLGLMLYLLISIEGEKAKDAAKKAIIIIGGTDALMIFGIALIWKLTGTLNMDEAVIPLTSNLAIFSFILLALGAFAKAGAVPLHTWIPDSALAAPLPVMALLPASLDKLLGIYFLAKVALNIFVMEVNSAMSIFLLTIGAVTIITAVMMALVQHNMKRLLSYHAVSQVGYMVLGIGTANPIGIAGGLFHMLNNAIYKTTLFLSAGAVEKETGTTDLDSLGGLAKFMPVSFVCFLIASLSISGVPPFNGFVSKWMIYQGIIETGSTHNPLWVVWLVAAMFGSALTLASFMKLLHAVFLGQEGFKKGAKIKEVGASMRIPMVILASLCVIFGIFAFRLPIKEFILPAISVKISSTGLWQPMSATVFILIGLAIGFIIYFLGNVKNVRVAEPFIGGETLPNEERPTGTEFYNTISDIPLFGKIYKMADDKVFDIYDEGKKAASFFTGVLQRLHNGILPTYLAWCLLGMVILLLILIGMAL